MENTSTKRSTLSADMIAGLTASIPSVPDAMASGVLAGVSEPVFQQMEKTGLLQQPARENVYRRTTILGDSSMKEYEDVLAWLKQTTGIIEP